MMGESAGRWPLLDELDLDLEAALGAGLDAPAVGEHLGVREAVDVLGVEPVLVRVVLRPCAEA
jgi:hypothetical protein